MSANWPLGDYTADTFAESGLEDQIIEDEWGEDVGATLNAVLADLAAAITETDPAYESVEEAVATWAQRNAVVFTGLGSPVVEIDAIPTGSDTLAFKVWCENGYERRAIFVIENNITSVSSKLVDVNLRNCVVNVGDANASESFEGTKIRFLQPAGATGNLIEVLVAGSQTSKLFRVSNAGAVFINSRGVGARAFAINTAANDDAGNEPWFAIDESGQVGWGPGGSGSALDATLGRAASGVLEVGGKIRQTGTPTASSDLATKSYVDAAASGTAASDYVRYVDPINGSDSNDGSTWAAAKKTVRAAVVALPENSATVPHRVGTVYVGPGQTVETVLPIPITRNIAIIGAPSGGAQGITSAFDGYGSAIKAGDDTNDDLFASDVFGESTTLSAAITNSGTTITVADASSFPTSSFVIRIGGELIDCSSRSGNTITASTRGFDFSTAVAHSAGEKVEQVYDDWSHRVYLANLLIDGNRANNVGGGYGIKLRQSGFQTALEHVTIKECRKAGLYLAERQVNFHSYDLGITHCGSAQQGYAVSDSGGSILLTAPASGVTTTTTEGLDVSETGVDVTSRSLFPTGVAPFVIQIGSERMLVTAGAGTGAGTFTVVRGYDGTTAATHSSGATVTWILPTGARDGDYVFLRNFSGAVTNLAVDVGYYVASTPTTDTLTLATTIGGSAIAYSAGAGATLSLEFPFGELIEKESGANGCLTTQDGNQYDDNARAHVGILHRSSSNNHKVLFSGFKAENKDGSQTSNNGISVFLKAVPGSDRFEAYSSSALSTAAAMPSSLTDGIVIQFDSIGSATGLATWERYWIVNRVAGTAGVTPGSFQVALTPGGTPVAFGGTDSTSTTSTQPIVQTMGGGATCALDVFLIDQRSATGTLNFTADAVCSQLDSAISGDAIWTARTDHAIVHLYGASEAQTGQTTVNLRGANTASGGFDYLVHDGRNSVNVGDPTRSSNVFYQGIPTVTNPLRQHFGQLQILTGSGDPSAGSGCAAPLGSLYLRSTGVMYLKTSAPDTGWTVK